MNDKQNLSIDTAGSMLLGAGLTKLSDDLNIGLLLLGVGILLKVGVALLQKYGLEVQSHPRG